MTRPRIDVDTAARLYREGWTLRRIAARLGCSFQRLSPLLREHGVEMRTSRHPRALRLPAAKQEAIRAAIREGRNAREVGRRVGVTSGTVARLAEREDLPLRKGRPLSWDLAKGQRLRGEGLSYEQVAAELGVTTMTVWRKLSPPQAARHANVAGQQ